MNRQLWMCLGAMSVIANWSSACTADDRLPGTQQLTWPESELADRLMDGAHRFVERQMRQAAKQRSDFWPPRDAAAEEWETTVKDQRQRLKTILGVVDQRLPPRIEYFGNTPERTIAYLQESFHVAQVRWPVLDGVFGEGLYVSPKNAVASVVLIPDADQTPEQLLGMAPGVPAESQIARTLIANQVAVLIPTLVGRDKIVTDDPRLKRSDQTQREWLYRQAFHMGRHIIGYELQKILAAIDWLEVRHAQERLSLERPTSSDAALARHEKSDPPEPIGVAGYGEGAMLAFFATAIDPRINVALVSGYFDSRERVWAEPIYRNVWSRLKYFGDAEIAWLIQPRRLLIEHSAVPAITGHKGEWRTPEFDSVRAELQRISGRPGPRHVQFVHGEHGSTIGPYSQPVVTEFLKSLGVNQVRPGVGRIHDNRFAFDPRERQQRTVRQIENHVQALVRKSEHVRDRFMLQAIMPEMTRVGWTTRKQHDTYDPQKFIQGTRGFRRRFHEQAIGKFSAQRQPFHARSRVVKTTDKWTAYDVVLDVHDDLFAWGVLLLPKDLQPGEKRPVVVCQHGRQGVPRDTIDAGKTAYNDFAARLAERGFVTFSPHNLYRGEDRYRWLDRKANTIGCSLFSFIVAQHDQILRWLDAQPFVDGQRIAFYGLSYGGETAVRVPTILQKYCLSICSGDFNQWTRKIAATDQPFSFMRTIEWEMPYWNLGNTFDYAEMTYLMLPRPFMVERGHLDGVGRDRWVAHEFAKVRWLYAQFGLADRVEIEFFQGGHSINGQGTFDFLHKHLKHPPPVAAESSR